MSNWYEFDHKSQKTLLTLMGRARKPIVLTTGYIVELSLETFTVVI